MEAYVPPEPYTPWWAEVARALPPAVGIVALALACGLLTGAFLILVVWSFFVYLPHH